MLSEAERLMPANAGSGVVTSMTPPTAKKVTLGSLRDSAPGWEAVIVGAVLIGICVFLSWFIVHFGRWQYGSWDYNLLVDTGWRQVLGQRPYVDFPTTTPPSFNLGIKLAYALFGVSWDAILYFTALFACATFLWAYWLMARLSMAWPAAIATSLAIQSAAMLAGCIWYFNCSTLVLAAIFFLCCLTYAQKPDTRGVQFSYVISLALLFLTKPNIAGPLIVAGILLLMFVSGDRKRVLGLTLAAAGVAIAVLLVNHISIPALLANYSAVARGRIGSGYGRYGFRAMSPPFKLVAIFWIALLSIPLLGLLSGARRRLFRQDKKALAIGLFCAMSLFVAVYGLITNSDLPELECTVLIAAGGFLVFGTRWSEPLLRIVFVVALALVICDDIYVGASRMRVELIGKHAFSEPLDNEHLIESGYLKNMRVSSTMVDVEREVELAKVSNPSPFFFGPRLEFNYNVLRLSSPEHSPVLWDPGAAFAESDQAKLIRIWQEHRFKTLIFLNANCPLFPEGMVYTFYPKGFRDLIDRDYVKDASYAHIAVYHRTAVDTGER
jgi:hypothetical protein